MPAALRPGPVALIIVALMIGVAVLGALSVLAINRGALFYTDTAAYLETGYGALAALGVDLPAPGAAGAGQAAPQGGDAAVVGSRSAIYAVVLATLAGFGAPGAMVFVNALALGLSVWLLARGLIRQSGRTGSAVAWAATGIIAGSAGSLPFVTASLMPDLYAPVLILSLAALSVSAAVLRWWEIALLLILALGAVFVHPSHLVIAALMLPVALFAAPGLAGRRLWLAGGLAVAIIGVGITEKLAFGKAVETIQHKQVIYLPFLTARLIDDGPGRDWLAAHCPDAAEPTCILHAQLESQTDPDRYFAPNILFSEKPGQGSFKLLEQADQQAVAGDQTRFVLAVVADRPLAVAAAMAGNIAEQLAHNSIRMTVPTPLIAEQAVNSSARFPAALADKPLVTANRSWISHLTRLHQAIYIVSAVGLVIALLLPGATPVALKRAVVVVLCGIFANAVVCGGISVPADRYGARVAFLLPMMLGMILAWPFVTVAKGPRE